VPPPLGPRPAGGRDERRTTEGGAEAPPPVAPEVGAAGLAPRPKGDGGGDAAAPGRDVRPVQRRYTPGQSPGDHGPGVRGIERPATGQTREEGPRSLPRLRRCLRPARRAHRGPQAVAPALRAGGRPGRPGTWPPGHPRRPPPT